MTNKMCPLHLTYPSVSLGQLVRSNGRYRTAAGDHLQLWSQAKGRNHLDFFFIVLIASFDLKCKRSSLLVSLVFADLPFHQLCLD